MIVFIFKQKTAYEMRISDWSTDVCSSDLFRDDDAYMIRTRDAANVRIGTLVERGVTSFIYTYDFGDNWRHRVEIEEVTSAIPATDYPRFVDGERRAPPEDVGGTPGFEDFLKAMAKPRHPERASMIQW